MAASLDTGSDEVFRLRDGRRIAYREFGASHGRPVLALHGTPGSRLMYSIAGPHAARSGLRLIAPDRWAYGGTDPHPRPSLKAWAHDAEELAGGLGLRRFSVVGISGGAPYAAATAAVLGDRIESLALVVPVGPICGSGVERQLGLIHRYAYLGLGRLPAVSRALSGLYKHLLDRAPGHAISLIALGQSRCDRDLLRTPIVRDFLVETFRSGLEQNTEGPVIDLRLFSAPWDVGLSGISARTRLWMGSEDRLVPPAAARELAGAISGSALTELVGHGHFWIARDYQLVLEWLAAEESVRQHKY